MQFAIIVVFIIIVMVGVMIGKDKERYREPGEATDTRNFIEFGEPARSLYTSTKILTLHHHIEITDDKGNLVYRAETQFPSIHDKTDIYTADGQHVAYIERKLITLREVHYIDMENGKSFTLSNEILHIIRDVTNIEGLGWILEGNILALNFTIRDAAGNLIAVVGQKLFSVHDKFVVDIYETDYEEEVVAILVTLQHMLRDRVAAASSGGAGSDS